MADGRKYKAPTLGGSISPKNKSVEASALTGEQVVAEVMRTYRLNDALAAENRALREKVALLEARCDGTAVADIAAAKENGTNG